MGTDKKKTNAKRTTNGKAVEKTATKKKSIKKISKKQVEENLVHKFCEHLAVNVLSWKWNKKKSCWTTPTEQEIEVFIPHINRIHAEWLLRACPRYSIEKLGENEICVRVVGVDGNWAMIVSATECQAICRALLALTKYKE